MKIKGIMIDIKMILVYFIICLIFLEELFLLMRQKKKQFIFLKLKNNWKIR